MPNEIKILSGSEINPFCLGIMHWVGKADRTVSQRRYQICRDARIRHFDTAYVHCAGTSEKLLGAFCKKERDVLLIAIKVGCVGGASKTNILTQCDKCQTRLKMNGADALYLYQFDPETPIDNTLETFTQLKQSSTIRCVGISNFSAWQDIDTFDQARALGLTIDFLQPTCKLIQRQAEVEILPMCTATGIKVAAYSPLCEGLSKGKYLRGEQRRLVQDDRYALRYKRAFMQDSAKKLCNLADALQVKPATLAVAWAHAHPTKPMPIISASGVDQLVPSIGSMTYPLSEKHYNQRSALSPTPPPATDRIEEA